MKSKVVNYLNIHQESWINTEIEFKEKLRYYCIIISKLQYTPICNEIYEGLKLDYFIKYEKLEFL